MWCSFVIGCGIDPILTCKVQSSTHLYVGDTSRINVAVETNDPIILLEIISSTNLLSITSTLAIKYRDDLVAVPLEGVSKTMTGCIHRLKDTYVKRSSSLFTNMLIESADLERMMG